MIRKSTNRFANFISKFIWRHSVTVTNTTECQAEIENWILDHVGRFEVWVNYNCIIHTDEHDVIISVSNTNKIEYRFLNVSSAVMFKLTFCDSLAH